MPFVTRDIPYSFIDDGIKIDDEKTIISALCNPKTCTYIINQKPIIYEFAGITKYITTEDWIENVKGLGQTKIGIIEREVEERYTSKDREIWRNDFRVCEDNITDNITVEFTKNNPDINAKNKLLYCKCSLLVVTGHLKRIEIYPGYASDGKSYPKQLYKSLFTSWYFKNPIEGVGRESAVLHDILCEMGRKHIYKDYPSTLITLAEDNNIVHRIYKQALLESGESKTKANIEYFFVNKFCKKWSVE